MLSSSRGIGVGRGGGPASPPPASSDTPYRPSLEMTFRGHRQGVLCVGFQPSYHAPSYHDVHSPGNGFATTAPASGGGRSANGEGQTGRTRGSASSPGMAPSSSSSHHLPPKVVSSGADGAVLLWDAKPTVRALRFLGHRGPVLGCAYSPKALLLASCGHDGYVRLWIPNLRRTSTTFPGRGSCQVESGENDERYSCGWRAHSGAARALAFATDGSDLLYTVGDDKSVKCWDLQHASSGSAVPSGGGGNRFVGSFLSSAASGNAGRHVEGHTNWVRCLAVPQATTAPGPFARLLASGGDDRTVHLWDTRTRKAVHVLHEPTGSVRALSFHPNGFQLASGDANGTINVYDVRQAATGDAHDTSVLPVRHSLLQHYESAHDGAVHAIDFAPYGHWLLSAGNDGVVRLWDVSEAHLYCTVHAHEGPVRSCRFSDDGQFFATCGRDQIVMVWRAGLPRPSRSARSLSAPTEVPSAAVPLNENKGTLIGTTGGACAAAHDDQPATAPTTFRMAAAPTSATVPPPSSSPEIPVDPQLARDRLLRGQFSPARPSTSNTTGMPSGRPPLPPPMSISSSSSAAAAAAAAGGAACSSSPPRSEKSTPRPFERNEVRFSHISPRRPLDEAGETMDNDLSDAEAAPAAAQQAKEKDMIDGKSVKDSPSEQNAILADAGSSTEHGNHAHESAWMNEGNGATREHAYTNDLYAALGGGGDSAGSTYTAAQRVENLERAVASLAVYLQTQSTTTDDELRAIRHDMDGRQARQRSEMTALKDMMATLLRQQDALMQRLGATPSPGSTPVKVPPPSSVGTQPNSATAVTGDGALESKDGTTKL